MVCEMKMLTKEDYNKRRKTVYEKKKRRPNFKIGKYQMRSNSFSYWFVDEKDRAVTGFHGAIGVSLMKDLRIMALRDGDLSGSVEDFIGKFRQVCKEFDDSIKETTNELQKEITTLKKLKE